MQNFSHLIQEPQERVQHQYFPDIDLVSDDVEEEREVPIETKAAKAATPPVSYTYVSSANSAKTAEVKTAVPGLRYIREFLTPTEEKKLIYLIDSMKWDTTLSRRTQQYGYIYDYSAVKYARIVNFHIVAAHSNLISTVRRNEVSHACVTGLLSPIGLKH